MPKSFRSLLLVGEDAPPADCGGADALVCDPSLAPRVQPGIGLFLTLPDEHESTLRSLIRLGPTGIVLTNCHSGADAQRLDVLLSVAEAEEGLTNGTTRILAFTDGLLPPPRSQAGFRGKSQRLHGLVWDWRALAQTLGAVRHQEADGRWTDAFAQARAATLIAAKAAGVCAYDVTPNPVGREFSSQCRAARDDGFDGRATVEPGQLAAINEAFEASA